MEALQPITTPGYALPGVQTLWSMSEQCDASTASDAAAAVGHVTERIANLAAVVGAHAQPGASTTGRQHAEVSIAQMLVREPRLLHTNLDTIARRLLDLHLQLEGQRDIAQLIQQHPCLLVDDAGTARCALASRTRCFPR